MVNVIAAKEVRAFEKRIASLLAVKWRRHYSEMVGFVRARMALNVVRGVTLKVRGSRCRKAWRPEWTNGAAAEGAIRGQCWQGSKTNHTAWMCLTQAGQPDRETDTGGSGEEEGARGRLGPSDG